MVSAKTSIFRHNRNFLGSILNNILNNGLLNCYFLYILQWEEKSLNHAYQYYNYQLVLLFSLHQYISSKLFNVKKDLSRRDVELSAIGFPYSASFSP